MKGDKTMKQITANGTKNLTKSMSKKAKKTLMRELDEILHTFDYSNYVPAIFYDKDKNATIIPKPLFAATFVNQKALEWVIAEINEHPGCLVAIT